MNLQKCINEIHTRHRQLGELAQESVYCYDEELFSSALSNLFIVAEQICKYANDQFKGNFSKTISQLLKKQIIDDEEYKNLFSLKELRNKLFHELHGTILFNFGGIGYTLDDPTTKKLLFKEYSQQIFPILEKLIKINDI